MSRSLRGPVASGALFIALIIIWSQAPRIALALQSFTQDGMAACMPPLSDDTCEKAFAKLGQTGDLFGAVSSLFSGFALLMVALTLRLDTTSRRNSRKPLVVCQISDDNPVSFDEPTTTNPRAIRVYFDLAIYALNDVAMNIEIKTIIKSGSWIKSFEDTQVPVPLAGNETTKVPTSLALRLDGVHMAKFLAALRGGQTIDLEIVASFTSLEGVKWYTAMAYVLNFRPSDREKLLTLDGDVEKCAAMWERQAIVQAESHLRPGSWRHYQ